MRHTLGGIVAAIAYDPIVRIRIGPLSVSPHGVGVAVGFLIGIYGFFLPGMRRVGTSEDDAYAIVIRVMLGALLGSRFFYVLNHISEFSSPLDWLKLWQGGFTLIGGITGSVLLAYRYCRKHGIPFFAVSDPAMPGLASGLIAGRLGDLVIADHLGKTTDFFLGYRCPSPAIVGETVGSPCPAGQVVHQTALYDLAVVVILLALLVYLRHRASYPGFLTMVFAFFYGSARVLEDFLRADKTILGLTGSQWAAGAVALYAAYVLFVLRRSPRWGLRGSDRFFSEESNESGEGLPDDSDGDGAESDDGAESEGERGSGEAPDPEGATASL